MNLRWLSGLVVVFLLSSAFFNLNVSASVTWTPENVDATQRTGEYSSLVLDSEGKPCISYNAIQTDDLKYAHWTNSAWEIQVVDSTGTVGHQSSLRLDSDGNPCISYYDYTNFDLKYAHWTGTAWNIETIDPVNKTGEYNSLALDSDDRPCIAYYDATDNVLKYSHWTGSAWNVQVVDSSAFVGKFCSLRLDSSDRPCISYYDQDKADLKYAHWTGSSWAIEGVASLGVTGTDTSLALDSNDKPCISYFDFSEDCLMYTKKTGSTWSTQKVDHTGEMPSLVLNPEDNPIIAYFHMDDGLCKIATLEGSSWKIEEVTSPNGSTNPSLAIDPDGKMHISYQSTVSRSLWYSVSSGQASATSSLRVIVMSDGGAKLSGVDVTSTMQPTGQTALKGVTEANGGVVFSLLHGGYTIMAAKSGFTSVSKSMNVALGPNEIIITLEAVATSADLKVIVKDKDGVPVSGANISSTDKPSGQSALSGTTGADGGIVFSGVLPGGYTLQASKSGYVTTSGQGNAVAGSTTSVNIVLQTSSPPGGIPGFPVASVVSGALLCILIFWLNKRGHEQYSTNKKNALSSA